ncbi:hypothetical protein C2S51_006349 [Perilla frutescens var. frutescens]|nr:hypothetical protein C2S51_006349 [Perilla frutescens var. frutescens]
MASQVTPKGKEMMMSSRQTSNPRSVLNSNATSTKNIPETSKWSPVSDAIVRISPVAKVNGEAVKTKIDEYMDTVLYGNDKSPLPVFEKLCREKQ